MKLLHSGVGAYAELVGIDVLHSPATDDSGMACGIIVQKQDLFFLHPWVSS